MSTNGFRLIAALVLSVHSEKVSGPESAAGN